MSGRGGRGAENHARRATVRLLMALAAFTAFTFAVCSAVTFTRLVPWWDRVPPFVLWPLARALLFYALDWALLLSIPLAFAWFATREEKTWDREKLVVMFMALACLSAVQWLVLTRKASDSEAPGKLVAQLITAAREDCDPRGNARIELPIVGLTWDCSTNPAHISGAWPQATFTARGLSPSADLRAFGFEHLSLSVKSSAHFPTTSLKVREARVRGLSSWGRPSTNQFKGRIQLQIGMGWVLAWVGVRLALAFGRGRAWIGSLVALPPSVAAVVLLMNLDQEYQPGWIYASVPLLLLAISETLLLVWRRKTSSAGAG